MARAQGAGRQALTKPVDAIDDGVFICWAICSGVGVVLSQRDGRSSVLLVRGRAAGPAERTLAAGSRAVCATGIPVQRGDLQQRRQNIIAVDSKVRPGLWHEWAQAGGHLAD